MLITVVAIDKSALTSYSNLQLCWHILVVFTIGRRSGIILRHTRFAYTSRYPHILLFQQQSFSQPLCCQPPLQLCVYFIGCER
jgi:hypothetical protein